MLFLILAMLICSFGIAAYLMHTAIKNEQEETQTFIENHKRIRLGMTKKQVVFILGPSYTQSILKNGIEKLEWRHQHAGFTSRLAKGAYIHSSSFTRKISVKFKDDAVIEVNCLNMD